MVLTCEDVLGDLFVVRASGVAAEELVQPRGGREHREGGKPGVQGDGDVLTAVPPPQVGRVRDVPAAEGSQRVRAASGAPHRCGGVLLQRAREEAASDSIGAQLAAQIVQAEHGVARQPGRDQPPAQGGLAGAGGAHEHDDGGHRVEHRVDDVCDTRDVRELATSHATNLRAGGPLRPAVRGAMLDGMTADTTDDRDLGALEAERQRIREAHLRPPGSRAPSSARGLHHEALISSDVERTVRFYQELLEFPLTELIENRDYPGSSHFFFDIGNGNLLAFFDFPGLDVGPYAEVLGGHHHMAISVEPDTWHRLVGKLRDAGVEHVVHSEVSVYFQDPDGARIELIADPLGEMYGSQVL